MSPTWTCIDCSTAYPARVLWCAHCGARGRVVVLGRRPRAELDEVIEVADASTLARLAGTPAPLPGLDAVLVGHGALAVLVGESGGGKSTLAARLLDAQRGPVVYASAEEGLGPTLAGRLARLGISRKDYHLLGRATVDQVVGQLARTRAVALALDSVQSGGWEPSDLRHLLAVHPQLRLLLAICQVNARGRPEGRHSLIHEADLVIEVAAMSAAITKSRYQEITNATAALPVLPRTVTGDSLRQAQPPVQLLRLLRHEDIRAGDPRTDRAAPSE